MKYLIVDVESTNGATNSITEIIEFGYAIIEDRQIVYRDGVYIKPHYSELDPFITQLTGITEGHLRNAKKFNTVAAELFSNLTPKDYAFVSWGNYDSKMIDKMCELWEMPRLSFAKRINLKNEHKRFYGFKDERGLQRALRHANIRFEGSPHSGADDAYNTAKIFLDMLEKGWQHN